MKKREKIRFKNTLGRKIQIFKPINKNKIGMYTCGPTVYARAHIGNLRAYIFSDIVRRTLEYAGYNVKQVMNITDVGHLTSDADEGEDKMQKAAREQRSTAWEISKIYTKQFIKDISELNIQLPSLFTKATEYIPEQINLIKKLEKKGFTYKTNDGIYFDTSKFKEYGKFAKLNIKGLRAGDRIEMGDKKNKTDFALWKFSNKNEKRDMEWDSPWGKGFPGWHIECSAMSMKHLGETFDVHTGGIDHIPIHHTNEIAQSQCATGKKFVNYWLHSNFLVMKEEGKMGKAFGNSINLDSLKDQNISPIDYRYFCLKSHYGKRLLYDKKIIIGAVNSVNKLKKEIYKLKEKNLKIIPLNKLGKSSKDYLTQFKKAIFNDLNTAQGIAIMWKLLKDSKVSNDEKYALILDFDNIFGLKIKEWEKGKKKIPKEIIDLFVKRNELRADKEWAKSDRIRDKLISKGYIITDNGEESLIEGV